MWIKKDRQYYKIFDDRILLLKEAYISKKNGKRRKIFIPNKPTKKFYRSLLSDLYERYDQACNNKNIAHGFLKNKSPVTNATEHKHMSDAKFNMTISLDIENFFPSITPTLTHGLSDELLELCFINGELPQGLPTSPLISNIVMISIDKLIINSLDMLSNSHQFKYTYTRYADDLSVSISYKNTPPSFKKIRKDEMEVLHTIEGVLLCNELKLNNKKTKINRFYDAVNVTGINIYNGNLTASRKTKRKLRAACHQKKFDSVVGLIDWIENVNDANNLPRHSEPNF
ncbi:TPA: reverse transcriptase family protein [Aeromonas veronii]